MELWNGVSMIPGVIMSLWFLFTVSKVQLRLPMIGYIITCFLSMVYHFNVNAANSHKLLRWDLIGQQIGLVCGISQTVMGTTSPLLLVPGITAICICNLQDANEKKIGYMCSAVNILLTFCWSLKACVIWVMSFACFLCGGVGHVAWHIGCHLAVNELFKHVMRAH